MDRSDPARHLRIVVVGVSSVATSISDRRWLGWIAILSITFLSFACSDLIADEPRPNILLICVDDLRPELGCYGAEHIHSPNIDGLAKSGRLFQRHYVQAPTCGASRYALLTGRYGGAGNHAIFQRAKQLALKPDSVPASMPAYFRQQGYTTVSVGKVSHHPGGRGGRDWNDDTLEMPDSWDRHLLDAGPWQHPRGWMHGLAHGEIRNKAGEMAVFQSEDGPDEIYPDGRSVDQAIEQLIQLGKRSEDQVEPFFLAVGILRPHLPFGAPAKYLRYYDDVEFPAIKHPEKPKGKTTWHGSGEFMKYQRWGRNPNTDAEFAMLVRKHYAACVSYADAQVGRLLEALNRAGVSDNTIVVLWGDHGWHLGEHAVWGKHTLFEQSLNSPLIISHPGMVEPGTASDAIVESIDLFPTLCELAKLPVPEFTDGNSLVAQLEAPKAEGRCAISYHGRARTIRTDQYRLIQHQDGSLELYDHHSEAAEAKNVANENGEISEKLIQLMDQRR